MQYLGGKSRIAKPIAEAISAAVHTHTHTHNGGTFVSLFCGSCAVESKIKGFSRVICNDKHPYLIALLRGVQAGYSLPEAISEKDYQFIRLNKELDPVLAGFVGFGCSFGGKWFGGYARNKGGTNYALQSKKSLLQDMATLGSAEFICGDYREVMIPQNAVVYADPPYRGTTGYGKEKFNSEEFWICMRLIAETEHSVFVSEQEAPPGWLCVWEKPFRRTLDSNKENQPVVTEKLFTYDGGTL